MGWSQKYWYTTDILINSYVLGFTINIIGRDVAKFGKELWERLNGKEEEGIDVLLSLHDMNSNNNYYDDRGHAVIIRFTRPSSS